MINVTFNTQTNPFDESITVEMAWVDNGDGTFQSMTKATYDAQQAEHFTPMVTDADKS